MNVYVVMDVTDNEGGWVVGVAASQVTARSLAESAAGKSLGWRESPSGLYARAYDHGANFYQIEPHEVQP